MSIRRIVAAGLAVAAGVGLTYVLPEYRLFAYGQFLAYLAAAAGLSVLVGLSGQLSIGHAGLMAVGGYTMALTQNALYDAGFTVAARTGASERFAAAATPSAAPWTLGVSLLAGIASAAVVGTALALATARLRGPYLAGLTLAFGLVVVPVSVLLPGLGGEQGVAVPVPRAPLPGVDEGRWRVWVALVAVAAVLAVLGAVVRGRFGRDLRAVRDDEVAAALAGIPVTRTRIVGFALSAATAGLGGGLYVHLTATVLPGYFSLTLSLYLLLAVVVGGAGSLAGAALGTLVVVAVPLATADVVHGLRVNPALASRLAGNAPLVLFGLTLVVVTVAAPGGIMGLLRRPVRSIREWLRALLPGSLRTSRDRAVDQREDGVPHPMSRAVHAPQRLATRARVSIAGSLVLLLALAACTGTPDPLPYLPPQGVSDTEIVLGTHQPLTGPASSYSRVATAMKAYFDHVNAHGGVHGRKITLLIEDDGYNPANTQTVVRKLVEQDKVFAIVGGLGTPTHSAVLDYLKDAEIPDLFVASGAGAWNQPSRYPGTFGFQTDYTTEGKIIGNYLKSTDALADKMTCSLGQDDDFGRELVAGVETGRGAPMTLKQSYITSNSNVAPQVQALQVAGCEIVVLATIPNFTAQVLSTASKLSYHPQFISSTVGSDYATVATQLGVYKGLLEGLVSTGYLPISANHDDPWIKLFQQINTEFGDGGEVDNNVVVGMSIAYLTVQALQRAGRDITIDGILNAVEAGGFRGPGLVPFSYSTTSHAGYSGGRMSKVTNGVQNYFGPAYVTDGGSAEVTEYTEPAATPPQDGIPTP